MQARLHCLWGERLGFINHLTNSFIKLYLDHSYQGPTGQGLVLHFLGLSPSFKLHVDWLSIWKLSQGKAQVRNLPGIKTCPKMADVSTRMAEAHSYIFQMRNRPIWSLKCSSSSLHLQESFWKQIGLWLVIQIHFWVAWVSHPDAVDD